MSEEVLTKDILILANSRKENGRCVAGITVEKVGGRLWRPAYGNEWVRPVSTGSSTGELTIEDRCYPDRSEPELLDVVEIGLKERRPKNHQTENWLMDGDYDWVKRGEFTMEGLCDIKNSDPLWLGRSSRRSRWRSKGYDDKNDRISLDDIASVKDSLRLIRVKELTYRVYTFSDESHGSERRRVRAVFTHRRKTYDISVTDPSVEQEYLEQTDGSYKIGSAYVTVSLGEPFEGDVYRVAAAIIEI